MAKSWPYFFLLLWFGYLISASILLFTGGFLLNRVASTVNATCVPLHLRPCTPFRSHFTDAIDHLDSYCSEADRHRLMNNLHSAYDYCLPLKSKVFIMIIDALHYNFVKYDESAITEAAYQNKMPIINTLLKRYPSSTRLYKFLADPPTTTMQRLKALTTGSLPTFIDAGSNFASAEIMEDNIIDQVIRNKHSVVFMGDDTWMSLYPNRFTRSYPFPSFNVFDLDTVDNGVIKHLYPELMNKDWTLLIAHFLGVDHCGHRYGPMHPEMTRKLTEMNNVIENVIEKLDDNTTLFVIGDHGMSSTGDHGGSSEDEITSAMFVYSKHSLVDFDSNGEDTIRQIDLVPTLAATLGIPIPFLNLGSVVVNSFLNLNETQIPFPKWHITLFSIWSNVQQMTQYIKDYSATTETFNNEQLTEFYKKYSLLNARVRTLNTEHDYKVFAKDAKEYMIGIRKMCEQVWAQFDSFAMSRGLVLIFIAIFLIYLIVSGVPSYQLPQIFDSSFLPCSYIALIIAGAISFALFYYSVVENLMATVYFATGITSIFMLAVLVIQNWEVIAIHWYSSSINTSSTDMMCRFTFLLSWSGLLSNSYIVEEGSVSLFLLTTILFLKVYEYNFFSNNKSATVSVPGVNTKPKVNFMKIKLLVMVTFICLILRLSTYFWGCREEQQWCFQNFDAHNQSKQRSTVGKLQYLITLITMASFVTASRNWLRSCGNLSGFSPSVFFARYAPTVIVVAIGGFWVLHKLPKDTKKLLGNLQADSLAWVAYTFVIAGIISIIFKPLCIYTMPIKRDVAKYFKHSNIIPQLFKRVKGLFNAHYCDNDENCPIVYGLATAYSAAFIAVSIYICLLLALLLGDVLAPSAIVLYFTAAAVLVFTALIRFENIDSPGELFEVPNSSVFIWMLLSLHFFYASGHQPTFPNIAWEAAFVGTGGIFTNNVIPALLVLINTFGSYILMGFTLPLLFIAPFTLCIIYPSLSPKHFQKDFSQGEITMFGNEGIMLNNVFTITCKYILYHACRVFVSMLASTIHCRHLMVWKIFAPKLIFEAIAMFVTLISTTLGYLFLININFKIDNLVTRLNKQIR